MAQQEHAASKTIPYVRTALTHRREEASYFNKFLDKLAADRLGTARLTPENRKNISLAIESAKRVLEWKEPS